jgi:hypothetical protein
MGIEPTEPAFRQIPLDLKSRPATRPDSPPRSRDCSRTGGRVGISLITRAFAQRAGFLTGSEVACRVIAAWGCSSAGRVPDWQSGGRGFDPRQLHQNSFLTSHLQPAQFHPLERAAFGCVWVAFFRAKRRQTDSPLTL